jgi:hypothetical protein
LKIRISFTRDEMKSICELLLCIKNNVEENSKAKIYSAYWKFHSKLSNSAETTQINLTNDEMSLLSSLLFYSNGEKLNAIFLKITEELRNYHALNGYYYTCDGLETIEF